MSDAWIREIVIVDNFVDKDLRIDLTPAEGRPFRHLILTGRNGCGKSATLRGLHQATPTLAPYARRAPDGHLLAWFWTKRNPSFKPAGGPTRERDVLEPARVEQMLLNWRTYAAFAEQDGDPDEANLFRERLADFERRLQDLLRPATVKLSFNRHRMATEVSLNGVTSRFNDLPDGPKAVLELWLGIWQAAQARGASGFVLLDEPETHLHAELQERILPFLAATFPGVQFIVATHSAAIAASLDDALVFDLSKKRGWKSEDLHGWRYGRVLTEIFGLDDEYSQSVTAELHRLEALRDLSSRNASEEAEYRSLAGRLAGSSHAMALEIWLRLNDPRLSAAG
jgi:ATPase subunit of ABC transporter with duplicated ATPase domains